MSPRRAFHHLPNAAGHFLVVISDCSCGFFTVFFCRSQSDLRGAADGGPTDKGLGGLGAVATKETGSRGCASIRAKRCKLGMPVGNRLSCKATIRNGTLLRLATGPSAKRRFGRLSGGLKQPMVQRFDRFGFLILPIRYIPGRVLLLGKRSRERDDARQNVHRLIGGSPVRTVSRTCKSESSGYGKRAASSGVAHRRQIICAQRPQSESASDGSISETTRGKTFGAVSVVQARRLASRPVCETYGGHGAVHDEPIRLFFNNDAPKKSRTVSPDLSRVSP